MRLVISSAIIHQNRILLVKKKETWILPGGKPEFGEKDLECLCREIEQEIPRTQIQNMSYYGEFQGLAPHTGDQVVVRVYMADYVSSPLQSAMEINDVQWMSYEKAVTQKLSDPSRKVIASLHDQNFLK